ncbi:phenylalanine--tRNA ligase subunit alpha [candidate division WWE3 bacterium]|nr:phenylalanine--tRNA ligase subunit alpha [candidate division WWE3 bacterium]
MIGQRIEEVRNQFESDIKKSKEAGNFDALYLKYFSRTKGLTTSLIKTIPALAEEDKKRFGPILNKLQEDQKRLIKEAKNQYKKALQEDPFMDLTIPMPPQQAGMLHPATQIIREINEFFRYYGFSIVEGPEIETAEYNFTKLNLPEGHPATDLQDTLFIKEPNLMLRTHTSSVEARILTECKPPIRAAFPGKCFRNETPNPSNGPFFYQYQGVVVDRGITIQNLMWTLTEFYKYLYGEGVQIRFRYKYYPEVSPGLGADVLCSFCRGKGCEVCKQRGWMEVLGSGMIHYNTLKMCGIDPEIYTGYAFGMGLDRMIMVKYGINDQRKLYGGGLAFL